MKKTILIGAALLNLFYLWGCADRPVATTTTTTEETTVHRPVEATTTETEVVPR